MEEDDEKYQNEEIKKYEEKYKNFLNENDIYQFFLKCQLLMPKIGKQKNDKKLIAFSLFALTYLNKYNEKESCLSILDLTMSIFKNNHTDTMLENKENFVKNFMKLYKLVPTLTDKTLFKYTFLEICEKNKIEESILMKYKVYELFSSDSLSNEYFIQGYKFALKSLNINLLVTDINEWFEKKPSDFNEFDKYYFLTRICFEILLLKQPKFALQFISHFTNCQDDFTHNPPIINYAYLLCNLFNAEKKEDFCFDYFDNLNEDYKNCLEVAKDFSKYIDKISLLYFNKSTSNQSGGFNFLNLLRSFTGS